MFECASQEFSIVKIIIVAKIDKFENKGVDGGSMLHSILKFWNNKSLVDISIMIKTNVLFYD